MYLDALEWGMIQLVLKPVHFVSSLHLVSELLEFF